MEKTILIVLLIIGIICMAQPGFSATVTLKSGKTVEGKIIEKTDDYIKIDFIGSALTYYYDEIEKVEGIENVEKAVDTGTEGNVEDSMKYTREGAEALQSNDVDKAVSLFEKAIKLNPNNFLALSALAGVYASFKRDLNKSVELFRKSIEIEDNYDMSHFGLGLTYADMGRKEEATREFKKTIEITDKEDIKDAAKRALLMFQ